MEASRVKIKSVKHEQCRKYSAGTCAIRVFGMLISGRELTPMMGERSNSTSSKVAFIGVYEQIFALLKSANVLI